MATAREHMKILVVTNLFYPDRGGGASVFSDLCFGLVERGHEVTVYGTYPYYPEWKNKSGSNLFRKQRESIEGVDLHRYGLFIPKNPSRLIPRVLYELSFTASLMRSLFRFHRCDVVMVFCPMAGAVAYGAVRKLFYREPLWLNVQDIPADAAAASGISRYKLFNRVGGAVQSWLFNRADVWSTIAPAMVERLKDIRKKEQPIHYCPNFLNGSMAAIIDQSESKVGRLPEKSVRLLYAGNIGKKQGLLEFCQVLAKTDLDFHFQIHGNGGEAATVQSWLSEQGDPRFQFGEFLDEKGFVDALFHTNFFVITEKPGVGASFIPSKLIPCIATGSPVLCVCDSKGPLGTEVQQYDLGICIEWPRIDTLVPGLRELLQSHDQIIKMQQNACQRAKFYQRSTVIEKVERELRELVPQ
jgi:colanic acid biosynthesis glycosyl transferase WcaI